MDEDTDLLFDLPSVSRKKVSAAFDGGRITSDGGVALLALAGLSVISAPKVTLTKLFKYNGLNLEMLLKRCIPS